jgi:hypothetical protein
MLTRSVDADGREDIVLRGFEVVATVPYTESTPALLNSRLPSAVDECTRNTVATK